MPFLTRVLVALASHPSDAGLLAYARTVRNVVAAGRGQWSLVHVLPPPTAAAAGAPVRSHKDVLGALENSSTLLGPNTTARVLSGSRLDRLLEFAAEWKADCILVGHRDDRSGRRSLARRLAMKAPCSVWMVPEGSVASLTRVLAAVDFSESSAGSLDHAALIASRSGARHLLAVHVSMADGRATQDAFRRFLQPLDLHGVDVESRVEESGSVARAVLRVAGAEDCDLIVMGSRGLGRSAAVLLGSESEQVLAESRRPVLVTRRRGERIGVLQVLLDRDFHGQEEPRFG